MSTRPTLMWEAAAAPGRSQELLEWMRDVALPETAAYADARLFLSHDDRVVVIATSLDGFVPRLRSVPADLIRRPPHQWRFDEVDVAG
jgi:hypothetical protein